MYYWSQRFSNTGNWTRQGRLEERLETNPEDTEARARLSLILLRAGSPDWSRKVLDEAPSEAWDSAAMHVMDGRLHLLESENERDSTGNHDQIILLDAMVAFDAAIERDRESGFAWLGRARALATKEPPTNEVALTRAPD